MNPTAGELATEDFLVNIPRLVSDYYTNKPDPENLEHNVIFGTSGHRGSAFDCTFNETHILAISQSICDYRSSQGIVGPLFLGMDTHALSEPALINAVEVCVANGVEVVIQQGRGYTPTPVISHAIITHNRANRVKADGIVITPSHNPPADGGFKYNPPHGGPAETDITYWIEQRANQLISERLSRVKRIAFKSAMAANNLHEYNYILPYIQDLDQVLDMKAISQSGINIGVDPMGGAGIHYWEPIATYYNLNLEVVSDKIDPTFSFMPVDKDGKIRMDCSSAYAMSGLIKLKNKFDIAFGNDPDFDRHGIVTRQHGLLNPNDYLATTIDYLCRYRSDWPDAASIGKTLVSSAMIDRVAEGVQRKVTELPVGFKWFVNGLATGTMAFAGEESAGASFLRKDGKPWCTDKDGFIMGLLAAEITAVTGKTPGEYYQTLTQRYGSPVYQRLEAPANTQQKKVLSTLHSDQVKVKQLAGNPITSKLTHAPGNNAAIGGLKVITDQGWFSARPSGTEAVYKIYTESFVGLEHLKAIQAEAKAIIANVFSLSDKRLA
ncbi:MAG: phosphoglucomutase (alpha-D-glucose-1,6-bisphosphate-dependent) [Endozoicomonas sp. (ex Botrylloides leachii)]|nr:phosphoglucomutase (alpha-D-glucose-1,6-bisphosphate-dependent) [Endozoicomonas sp. (ex Botrylloides leachii)]